MPRVRDLLYRFRPSAAPGAATAAGVPADRARDLAAELDPVFALLASTEREGADVLAAARAEAGAIRERGAARAAALVEAARSRADGERIAAATAARQAGMAELSAAADQGQEQAQAVHARVERLLPDYVERVVDSVQTLFAGPELTELAGVQDAERGPGEVPTARVSAGSP